MHRGIVMTLMLGLIAVSTGGDQQPAAGRVVAGLAADRSVAPGFADFHLFGWFAPPADSTTPARIAEVAGAGFDLMLHAWADSGRRETNRQRLDLAGPFGMRCMLWDRRMDVFDRLSPRSSEGAAALDSIVADWGADSALFGYYLGDEPRADAFELLAGLHGALRARDPAHPAWNNLFGRGAFKRRDEWLAYTRDYADRVRPVILCNDHYDFTRAGDRGQFVENAAGLAAVARASALPWWGTIQLIAHAEYRPLSVGEVRWQAAMLLAYGARGMGYFTYWTPAPDPRWNWQPAMIAFDGVRTPLYDMVAEVNRRVRPAGRALAACTWLATGHAGSLPEGATWFARDDFLARVGGRAVLAHFADTLGHRVLFVANPDSTSAQRVVLRFVRPTVTWRLYFATGGWEQRGTLDSLALDLAPGGFDVLRFGGDETGWIVTGTPPATTVRDTIGGLAMYVAGDDTPVTLEILDRIGARVWSATTNGDGAFVWPSASAPPGPYQLRIEDGHGVRVRRVTVGRRAR